VQITRESSAANVIRAYEAGRLRVNEAWIAGHVIVSQDRILEHWNVEAPSALALGDLEPALALQPEIVLLGTGSDIVLPDVELMAAMAARGIGLEIMTTAAACRTFNVLVHERRRVAAALFNPPG
jgi:uncharacterized protein